MEKRSKRLRTDDEEQDDPRSRSSPVGVSHPISRDDARSRSSPVTLSHPISPPRKKARLPEAIPTASLEPVQPARYKSPFELTKIKDLDEDSNVDTVTLHDLLGDPLISECWDFNYLHDIDFLMSHFDQDVRSLVKVHVVHGFWKREDESRIQLQVRSFFR